MSNIDVFFHQETMDANELEKQSNEQMEDEDDPEWLDVDVEQLKEVNKGD